MQNNNMTDDELIEKLMLADDELKEIRQKALILEINNAFAKRERPLIPAFLKG